MAHSFIPVSEPLLDGNELRYASECITSGWISSEGPYVTRFEEEFSKSVGRRYGIAVANGTVALELALRISGVKDGDEVILPTFSIISCVLAVIRAGATPVLVDSDPITWNMRAEDVENAVTKNTRAILVVHTYGLPVEMTPMLEVAKRHNLTIIEDAAEVHGQTYRSKPCGSFGAMSIFSFYANKLITTGEGGMIVTDDPALAAHARKLRNLGFQENRRFVHEELGYNFRLTNLQCAIGVAQLERSSEHLKLKRQIAKRYHDALEGMPTIQLPLSRADYAENAYWVFGVVLRKEVPFDAAEAMKRLRDLGIGTRPFFYPVHMQPVFLTEGRFTGATFPVAENLSTRGFYIPMGLTLTEGDQQRIIKAIKDILNT